MEPIKEGHPCGHPGCLSHTTKPCEGCGRIAGEYPVLAKLFSPPEGDLIFSTKDFGEWLRVKANGDIYIRGELVVENRMVARKLVKMMGFDPELILRRT